MPLKNKALKDRLKDPSLVKDMGYIDGSWVAADAQFDVVDPATGDVIGHGKISQWGANMYLPKSYFCSRCRL